MRAMLTGGNKQGQQWQIQPPTSGHSSGKPDPKHAALGRGSRHATDQRRKPSPVSSMRIAADDASCFSPGRVGRREGSGEGGVGRRLDVRIEAIRQTGMLPVHQYGDQVCAGVSAARFSSASGYRLRLLLGSFSPHLRLGCQAPTPGPMGVPLVLCNNSNDNALPLRRSRWRGIWV
ncbi:hypothetical protein BC567DRAFT_60044 [Phyllosticta citribraziliensis]